jgi:hypothetical protein
MDVENLLYATLSHCWGHTLKARLLKNLVNEYWLDVPWKDLTLTFQDAITTSLKLGIYYIWIDALCIIQDSEEDWMYEAGRMTGVYLNSYLNISADASRDGTEGLFRERDTSVLQSFVVPHGQGDSRHCASIFYTSRWFGSVSNSPLAKRAWTVQEMFLAPRVLHFAEEEVHWECSELLTAESMPTLFNTIPGSSAIMRKSALRHDLPEQERIQVLYDIWHQLVTDYSAGALTFISDRAIAIAGLAGIFCRLLGLFESDYLCGIWRPQLPHDLMRQRLDSWAPQDMKISDLPSWSWLSTCAGVWIYPGRYGGVRDDNVLATAEIVHASTTPSQVPFGPVSSGKVVLRVFLYRCTIKGREYCDWSIDIDGSTLEVNEDFMLQPDDDGTQMIDKPVYLMLGRARNPESHKLFVRTKGNVP